MTEFTPFSALFGGVLLGLSATGLLYTQGRIAGVSGIYGGLLKPVSGDLLWRLAFVSGLLAGGLLLWLAMPSALAASTRPMHIVALAGLFVGFGTRMGNGCTSGHGVCGLTRRSPRSLVAVVTFMLTGFAAASASWLLFGGV